MSEPLELELYMFVSFHVGVGSRNLVPLQEWQGLLTTKPSLWPLSCFVDVMNICNQLRLGRGTISGYGNEPCQSQ